MRAVYMVRSRPQKQTYNIGDYTVAFLHTGRNLLPRSRYYKEGSRGRIKTHIPECTPFLLSSDRVGAIQIII